MDWIRQWNETMDYIEENLAGEISYDRIAQMAGCSVYNFQRMFSYITETPLSEYVRKRRLTVAAFELLNGNVRLLDLALKYGYESQEAFSRAFRVFHGVLPSAARNQPVLLKSYPKLSFQITIQGETPMNYQIKQYPAFSVAGFSSKMMQAEVFTRVPALWDEVFRNGTINRVHELFRQTDYHPSGILGVAGSWDSATSEELDYLIGCTNFVDGQAPRVPPLEGMTEIPFPAATWAVFEANGPLPEAVQRVHKSFYTEWLPKSGYRVADLPVLESYLLENQQSVWIAVEKI